MRVASQETLSPQFKGCACFMTQHGSFHYSALPRAASSFRTGSERYESGIPAGSKHFDTHPTTQSISSCCSSLRATRVVSLPKRKKCTACICLQAAGGAVNCSAFGSSVLYMSFVQSAFSNNSVFASTLQVHLCHLLPTSQAALPVILMKHETA